MPRINKQVQIAFPLESRPPIYVNATLVSTINGDFIIDFGFVDPFLIQLNQNIEQGDEKDPQKETQVPAVPITRLVLNRQVLESLMQQLQENLNELKENG